MQNFLKLVAYLFFTLVIMSISLDWIFSYIQKNNEPRNVPDYIMSLKATDTLDYAVFGSSRVLHYLDIDLVEQKTEKKGFNFGVQGSNIFEIKLGVLQIIKKNITKKIFIQVDYNWNNLKPSGRCTVEWLPYINNEEIWNEFEKVDDSNEYLFHKRIPFYRYCKFDSKLGLRKTTLSFLGKRMKSIERKGFIPLEGIIKEEDFNKEITYVLENNMNLHIEDIVKLCNSKGVEIQFFTAPILNFRGDLTVLKTELKNYHDFSNALKRTDLFSDNEHVNGEGAIKFTNMFIEKYFQ